jgi:hypothetical protein
MATNLQLVEQPEKPERCAAENLKPGQFLAAGALTTGRPTEVLFVDTYPSDGGGRETLLVHRPVGVDWSISSTVGGNHWFDLATEQDLADFRAGAERVNRIADIRRLADWLEDNSWAPMPNSFDGSVHLDERHLGGPGVAESYAKVCEISDRLGIELEKRLGDRTVLRVPFGRAEYSVIAWHPGGRPADPELRPDFVDGPCVDSDCPNASWPHLASSDLADPDPTGLAYSRADDGDEPQPVAAREPMHTGGLTEAGLIDESVPYCPRCTGLHDPSEHDAERD